MSKYRRKTSQWRRRWVLRRYFVAKIVSYMMKSGLRLILF